MTKPTVLWVPVTDAQKRAARAYRDADVLFLLGPAGGGKTHAAVGLALADVLSGARSKVLLTRPLVGCDEDLGYLPGDLGDKLGPWMGALTDVLSNLTTTRVQQLPIETTPLALMRGRTISRAVGILDEAQNATLPQIRMFLSRIGEKGKLILTGDPHQADRPGRSFSRAARALAGMPGVAVIHFPASQVVRHPLIPQILSRLQHLP